VEFMHQKGFLGTKAPLFMDEVTLIVALLPVLLFGAIQLARMKLYKAHALSQIFLYVTSIAAVFYFEFGIRAAGGFHAYIDQSSVSHPYFFAVLVLHVAIALSTLIFWTFTLFAAKKELVRKKHKRDGLLTFFGVTLTSLSGIWVYLLLFLY